MQQHTRVAGIMTMLGFVLLCARCSAPSPAAQQADAEAKYGAEQLACVDDAGTLAASKACRAEVDRRWGVVQTVTVPPTSLVRSPLLLDGGARDGGAS